MEKSSEPILFPEESQDHNLNRRELLKVLAAAGGGLAAAAFLPGKWLKPVVEAGVLPAHAQTTDTLRLTGLSVWVPQGRSEQSGSCVFPQFRGSAVYQDDYCKVGEEPTQLVGSCPTMINWSVPYHTGGSCSGVFGFTFQACCNQVLSVYLEVGSRQSATATDILSCGNG